jgi:hypothetical protein
VENGDMCTVLSAKDISVTEISEGKKVHGSDGKRPK